MFLLFYLSFAAFLSETVSLNTLLQLLAFWGRAWADTKWSASSMRQGLSFHFTARGRKPEGSFQLKGQDPLLLPLLLSTL